ncbi:HepT-like ribonuclease domain-containing protein [Corynebacterium sp. KPL2895]|uniref:HepT-like ribonuclease domain-containing protein n=1 Tax=Corynebacterium sp. KPL2895 TaxID=3158320 RepID=UPI0032ED0050
MLQQGIDLATDIDQHIAATTLNVADSSSRRGFEDLLRASVLPADLEQDFYKSLALRNVITHHYVEVDLGIVSNSIPRVLDVYTQYVKSISRWLASR